MTREEVIQTIESYMPKDEPMNVKDREAFFTAIKALKQERSRSAEITQYRHDCEKLMEENERLKKALEQEPNETVTEFADRCRECGREKVLDKIRAEILEYILPYSYNTYVIANNHAIERAIMIIDKHKVNINDAVFSCARGNLKTNDFIQRCADVLDKLDVESEGKE